LLASSQHNLYVLLCVQYSTPDEGQRNFPKHVEFYSKNKLEKLVHLFCFIIRVYHDAWSSECQIHLFSCTSLLTEQRREEVGNEALVIRYNREEGGKKLQNGIWLNINDETSSKGLRNCTEILDLEYYSHFYIK